MEIVETVIFIRCHDFAKTPYFAVFFCQKCSVFKFLQEYFVFNQSKLNFIV